MDKQVRLLALLIVFPALAVAQTPEPIPAQPSMFQELSDSQWVRVSGDGHARREARLLEHSATEIVLDLERPLRIPATSIDTLWERRTASKTGAWVGGLVGAGVGILVATQAIEKGETPPADYIGLFAIGGAVGGGLLGALVGRAFPKWHRLYTRSLAGFTGHGKDVCVLGVVVKSEHSADVIPPSSMRDSLWSRVAVTPAAMVRPVSRCSAIVVSPRLDSRQPCSSYVLL